MTPPRTDPRRYVIAISRSGLSIYDPIDVGDPELWIPTTDLEILLDTGLRGISLAGLPLRTRSKIVKEHVCRVLGYPLPTTFRKTQPRFPGQCFDTYVQKANNLQVWNEELEAIRRYVLIRQSEDGTIRRVKVVTGDRLAELDRTGTLTQKYQARCVPGPAKTELVTHEDTALLRPYLSPTAAGSLVRRAAHRMVVKPGGDVVVTHALAFHNPAAFGPDAAPGADNLPKGLQRVMLVNQTAA